MVLPVILGVLAGCQVSTSPKAGAAKPAASATPAAKASPRAELLVVPAGAVTIAGTVQVDPTYVVQAGGGQLLSPNGAGLLSPNGAGVIAPNGASVLAAGSAVIAPNGAGLISPDGARVIANNSGNVVAAKAELISEHGNGLIGEHGNGLIAPNGGSLTGKVKRRLFASDDGLVTAAGMVVGLRSLVTGELVPIGKDGGGQDVFALYTNLQGAYRFAVPADVASTVEVVAVAPGTADDRLVYRTLTAGTGTASSRVDDDTSVTAAYVREAIQALMLPILQGNLAAIQPALPKGSADVLMPALQKLEDTMPASGPKSWTPAQQRAQARRIAERILAEVDLTKSRPDTTLVTEPYKGLHPADADCLAILAVQMAHMRGELARRFKQEADPTVFSRVPSVTGANQRDGVTYEIKRPADYGMFVASVLVGANGGDPAKIDKAVSDFEHELGVHGVNGEDEWFRAALTGLQSQLGVEFASKPLDGKLDALFHATSPP
jgi:hypothetical protein